MTTVIGLPPETLAAWMVAAVGLVLAALLVLAAFNRMLLRMAMRNLVRRRLQTVLILFGLMLATLMFTASMAVGDTMLYGLQATSMREMGGIDEAFTRHFDNTFGASPSTAESELFSETQAAEVIARSLADPNVVAGVGIIATPGSTVDITTSQSAASSVTFFGVPPDFHRLWGTLRSRSGTTLDLADLAPDQVYIGNTLAGRLDARAGDHLQLYVGDVRTEATVREVLDTEIDPRAGWPSLKGTVLMPLQSLQRVVNRPDAYNMILLRNRGSGGVDDLGPGGATGRDITRRLRAAFIDPQAALDLKAYLSAPAMRSRLTQVYDQTSMFDPGRSNTTAFLAALDRQRVDDEFLALSGDSSVQLLMSNAVTAAVPASAGEDARRAAGQELADLLASLHVDSRAAAEVKDLLGMPEIRLPLSQVATANSAAVLRDLLVEVQRSETTPKFKAMVGDPSLQRGLAEAIGRTAPNDLQRFKEITSRLDLYIFWSSKADAVFTAQIVGLIFSSVLLIVSGFSMAVGALLIFLIFVMLAAERRAEMGMSRALGLKRGHLIQVFLFEGTAYTLAASAVGVVLGVLVGWLLVAVGRGYVREIPGFVQNVTFEYRVEWPSLAIAAAGGVLLTFVIVAFSAYRVSRMNIVSAIRGLDESESRDPGLARMLAGIFSTAGFAVRQLVHGHPLIFLSRITLGTLGSVRTFLWALFRRGPMTMGLGVWLVLFAVGNVPVIVQGTNSTTNHIEVVYAAGVSLIIIGVGLTIRWASMLSGGRNLIAARLGFTVAALGLLIYWGRPFGPIEKVLHIEDTVQFSRLGASADLFVISGLMVLLGTIWLVMYNSDLLIRAVMFVTGRIGGLAAITRTSMAYPLANKFRTGMAVAMFALVTFSIVLMAVFIDVTGQNTGGGDADSGGWQIVAGSPAYQQTANRIFPADLAARVSADSTLAAEVRAVGWENADLGFGAVRRVRPDNTIDAQDDRGYTPFLRVVDDGYLSNTGLALKARAVGYASDRALWEAVRDNAGYVVIDDSVLHYVPVGTSSFLPFALQVSLGPAGAGGVATRAFMVTVVGTEARPVGDMYLSTRTALAIGLFAQSAGASSPHGLTTTLPELGPSGYYFMLVPGVDARQARRDLGRMLVQYRLEPVLTVDQVAGQRSALPLFNLVTGFLAQSLIVGIAGLGVISTRAVIERWQQIGMLRALGYRRGLVQRSFLIESSLVAILGLLIGVTVGLWQSYRFFVSDAAIGAIDFHVPVAEIAGIVLLAYAATLLTTYLPSRAAARVAPAEALRYE